MSRGEASEKAVEMNVEIEGDGGRRGNRELIASGRQKEGREERAGCTTMLNVRFQVQNDWGREDETAIDR